MNNATFFIPQIMSQKFEFPTYQHNPPENSSDLFTQFQRTIHELSYTHVDERTNLQNLLLLSEEILPNISLAAQDEIPFYDKLISYMMFQLQKDSPRLDTLIIHNVVSKMLSQLLKYQNPKFKQYYLGRLFQVIIVGLGNKLVEVQAAFAAQLYTMISMSQEEPILDQLIRQFRLQLVYSFTSFEPKPIIQITPQMDLLFDCAPMQDLEKLEMIQKHHELLEVIELVLGTPVFLQTLFQVLVMFKDSQRVVANAAFQIKRAIVIADEASIPDFSEVIRKNRQQTTEIILSQKIFTEHMFECISVMYLFEQITEEADLYELVLLILHISRIGDDQPVFANQLNIFLNLFDKVIKHYLHGHEVIDLKQFFQLTYNSRSILRSQQACELFQEYLTFQIYEDIASIIELNESDKDKQLEPYIQALKNIMNCDFLKASYYAGIAETMSYTFQDQEIRKQSQMVQFILIIFGVEFFPIDVIINQIFAPKQNPNNGIYSGQLILIAVLNDYLVKVGNISSLRPFLEQSVGILINHYQTLQSNLCDIKVFVQVLNTFTILHERSIEMLSYNYFTTDLVQKNYQYLCENVLIPLTLARTHDNLDFWRFYESYMIELNITDQYQPPNVIINDDLKHEMVEFYEITELSKASCSQPLSTSIYDLSTQSFLLLAYLLQIAYGDFQIFIQKSQPYFQSLLHLANCFTASFSSVISEKATTVFGVLTLQKQLLEYFLKPFYLERETCSLLKLTRFKILQNISSKSMQLSIINRLMKGIVDSPSSISKAPLVPITSKQEIDILSLLYRNANMLLMPRNEKLAENATVTNQYIERALRLRKVHENNLTQVTNQFFNLLDDNLCDLLYIAPLKLLNDQTYFKQKLLNMTLQTSIEYAIKVEPEIIIKIIESNIQFFKNDQSLISNELLSPNTVNFSQTNLINQELRFVSGINKMVKIPLQLFSEDYVELPTAVIEYCYQKLQKYLAVSQIDEKMQFVVQSLFDLIIYSAAQIDVVYRDILRNSTNFTIKQLQNSGYYGTIVLSRLKIFKQLSKKQYYGNQDQNYYSIPCNVDLYRFWRDSLVILLDFDKYFETYQQGDFLTKFMGFDQITDFFFQIQKDIMLDITKITDVLQILILNVRPETQILLTSFLQMIDSYAQKQLALLNYQNKMKVSHLLSFIQSQQHYTYFLVMVLFVQLTYPGQFQNFGVFLDSEIVNNPDKHLIFKLFNAISGLQLNFNTNRIFDLHFVDVEEPIYKNCTIFALYDQNVARDFYSYFNYLLLTSTERYQKEFVGLVHRYNQMHIMTEDIATLFNNCHEHRCVLLLYLIVGYRIRDIDNSHRDSILEQFSTLLQRGEDDNQQSTNFIILKFLSELLTNVSSIHDILIRKHTNEILSLILAVVIASMDQSRQQQFRYFSRRKAFVARVFAGDAEIIPMLEHSEIGVADQKEFFYEYDVRVRELLGGYIQGLALNAQISQDGTFVFAIFCAFANQLDSYEDVQQLPTLLALLDRAIDLGRALVQRGQFRQLAVAIDFDFTQLVRRASELLADEQLSPALQRRLLWLLPLMVQEESQASLILSARLTIKASSIDAGFREANVAADVYNAGRRFAQDVILPLAYRVAEYQELNRRESLRICDFLLNPVVQLSRHVAGHEFQLAVSSAFYEAKLAASESRNCRLMFLPFALLYQIMRKFAACELELWHFADQFRCWAADPFCISEGWYKELKTLDDIDPADLTVEQWYAKVVKAATSILV